MVFNFGISADSAVRTTRKPLAPWNIYDVKFMGCEVSTFQGKKDPSQSYTVLKINFEAEDGAFTVTQFFPKEGDNERREVTSRNGGKVILPSNFETLMAIVKQTAQVLNPSGFEKMQAASSKFKSFDDVAHALIKVTDPKKGTETKLKLIGRNRDGKVVAEIPRIVGINKQGEAFIADNYIGNKLFFSTYEEDERQKYLNTEPTNVEKVNPINDVLEVDTADSEFDLDNLL